MASLACCDPIFQQIEEWQTEAASEENTEEDRTGTAVISLVNEIEMGDESAGMIEKKHPVIASEQTQRVMEKITRFADRPILTYDAKVLDGTEHLNAFSIAGGHLYITRALIEALEPTDGELAFILGHEIAHAALRHIPNVMERAFADFRTRATICIAAQEGRIEASSVNPTFQTLDFSEFQTSVQNEFEADQYGALYMLQAGYKFSDATNSLKKLRKLMGDVSHLGTAAEDFIGGSIWSLPTHPPVSQRLEQLERFRNQLAEISPSVEAAIELLETGRYKEAASSFSTALKVFPESRAMRLNLALANHLQFRESQSKFPDVRGVLSTPEKLEIEWIDSLTRGRAGDPDKTAYDKAIKGYEKVLAKDPDHFPARNNLAVAYLDMEEPDRAIAELERAITANGTYSTAHRNLALAYLRKAENSGKAADNDGAAANLTLANRNWEMYKVLRLGQVTSDDTPIEEKISELKLAIL